MQYTGVVFDFLEENGRVKEAVITAHRVSIDWQDNDGDWHLEATSTDGCLYSGKFGEKQLDPKRTVELGLYKAKTGAVLLLGQWVSKVTATGGTVVFRLFPNQPESE